ncbi:MAG: DUF72 domain-containing protein, partial [Dehalococcoidia bacterium]|nr:DUF72 domain-containing protein [Dehalococcoidia bacterium]
MTKIGCCCFPKGMKHYFSRFKLVEVQQTFYKPPQVATALMWRGKTPTDFEFAIKAWQLITHPCSSPTYRKAGLNIPQGKEASYGFFRPTAEVMGAWSDEGVRALCEELDLVHCVDPFQREPLYGVVSYFRLHGGWGYRHKYTDEELKWLGDRWGEGYFLFNNLSMYDDALRLER